MNAIETLYFAYLESINRNDAQEIAISKISRDLENALTGEENNGMLELLGEYEADLRRAGFYAGLHAGLSLAQ